jgi:hypothetical protein
LRQLRNPFNGGASQDKTGFFQYPSPQYTTGPGMGAGPGGSLSPGAMPGATTPGAIPGAETTPGAGAPGTTPPAGGAAAGAGATGADAFGAAATTAGPGYGGALEAAVTPFAMIGDLSPLSISALARTAATNPGPPPPPGPRGASPVYAAARNVKVSENQSPRPQDRIYFNFNYYNNVNDTLNRRDLSPVTQMKAYTYLFGIEKTFNDGKGSIGFRVPLDNLTANSNQNVLSTPTSTASGNLSVIAKYILEQNMKTGSLVSVGFAITAPTGPSRFAGAPYLFPLNSVYFQPFIGYIYNYNRWYIQGFTGFNFTSNINDVSYIFNDIGVGYYLLRDDDPRAFLSAVAPTFELHVNNPINHRDVFNRFDIAGMPDTVDLTFGLNFQFRHAAVLTFAYVTPVASPKPFDSEAAVMLNIFYGRTRAGLTPITPPPAL